MSVWFCIPSARPVKEANRSLSKWRERGYRVGLWRDTEPAPELLCDLLLTGRYPGYANAVNAIAGEVLKIDPECRWIVDGGDDTEPDENHDPGSIAEECEKHFGGTFGVMQPTGDRWAGGSIDRIAGSAWMGREWCERANGGAGPLWHEFTHMFVDDCLQETAKKCGVFWQRRDLSHMHRHFLRNGDEVCRSNPNTPAHLVKWNSPAHWAEMQAVYVRLKNADFAPCMPIARGA